MGRKRGADGSDATSAWRFQVREIGDGMTGLAHVLERNARGELIRRRRIRARISEPISHPEDSVI